MWVSHIWFTETIPNLLSKFKSTACQLLLLCYQRAGTSLATRTQKPSPSFGSLQARVTGPGALDTLSLWLGWSQPKIGSQWCVTNQSEEDFRVNPKINQDGVGVNWMGVGLNAHLHQTIPMAKEQSDMEINI